MAFSVEYCMLPLRRVFFFFSLLLGFNAFLSALLPNLQPLRTIVLFSHSPTDRHHLFSHCHSQTYYWRVGDFAAAKPSESVSQTFNSDTISQLFPTGDQLERECLDTIHPSAETSSHHYSASCPPLLLSVDPDSSYSTEYDSLSHCHTVPLDVEEQFEGGRGLSSSLMLWLTAMVVQGHIYYTSVFYTEWNESSFAFDIISILHHKRALMVGSLPHHGAFLCGVCALSMSVKVLVHPGHLELVQVDLGQHRTGPVNPANSTSSTTFSLFLQVFSGFCSFTPQSKKHTCKANLEL